MRSRNIKPGFFDNEILGSIDPSAQLLFAGLWCLADRDGRLEDRPLRIKAQIFPYRQTDIDKLLALLTQSGFIIRYEIEGQKYIHIPKFKEHQNPHPHEAKSKIPDISMSLHVITCNVMSVKCNADIRIPDSLIPDSLIPDSLIPDSQTFRDDTEKAGVSPPPVKVKKPKPPKEKKPISAAHPLFIAWWCYVFEQTQGDTYIVEGGKDGQAVKAILAGCKEGIREAMGRACYFLAEDDSFWHGKHTIGLFRSQINKCRPSVAQMDKYRRMGLFPPTGEDVAMWVNAIVAGGIHQADGAVC